MYLFWLFLSVNVALFFSCSGKKIDKDHASVSSSKKDSTSFFTEIKYAKGFDIEYYDGYKVINVKDPWSKSAKNFRYVLFSQKTTIPSGFEDAQFIEVPVKKFITLSSLYVGYSEKLRINEKLIGIADTKYINTSSVREMISKGKIEEVGGNENVNIEKILELNPDLIITYGSGDPSGDAHPKLLEAGLKVAVNSEQMEVTPLGRTEWIKFIASFFDKDREADSIFKTIESKYFEVAKLAQKARTRPSVFSDVKYGDTWFMPGGQSYAANLLKDANTNYLWADIEKRGSIPFSFETVYVKALNADFWINTSDFKSLEDIARSDIRYKDFKAYKTGNIFNNNKRLNEAGGNDYWESGLVSPDVILSDLVKIFHPELLQDYELVYYKKIQAK
jgi:iron complex transport system substrate-binding protein